MYFEVWDQNNIHWLQAINPIIIYGYDLFVINVNMKIIQVQLSKLELSINIPKNLYTCK